MNTPQILGISGSLRKKSLNRALLHEIARLGADEAAWRFAAIGALPLYDPDLDVDGGPPPVRALREQVAAADALLIVTPEYNYSIPGGLKNALDWLSRPAYKSVLASKPVAMAGVSPGAPGTSRAQQHLKLVLLGTISLIFPYPELAIGGGGGLFDEHGRIKDQKVVERVSGLARAFPAWVRQHGVRARL